MNFDDDFLDDDFLDDDKFEDEFDDLYRTESLFEDIVGFFKDVDKKIYIGIGAFALIFLSFSVFQDFNDTETTTKLEDAELNANSQDDSTKVDNQDTVENTTTTKAQSISTTTSTSTTIVVETKNDFDPVKATVLIWLPNCGYAGSGTIVSNLGYILTNEHVISDDGTNCNSEIIVFTTSSADKDPLPKYYAEIVTKSVMLDLAVLEITSSYGGSYLPKNFYNACLGDSESVSLSDNLLIWGYPDVRGIDSIGRIDVTNGFVSGFESEDGISKAWLSMSADISYGNSGGGAYNSNGELVAVTTGGLQSDSGTQRGLLRPINIAKESFSPLYFDNC